MMQQVDLLADELKPRREPLTLQQLALAWGGLVALLVVVSAWQGLGVWQLSGARADRESEIVSQTRAVAGLRASVATEPEPVLVTEVAELRERFDSQSLMVAAVRRYEQASDGGFSRYLADLAAQHVEGMALQRIELRDGGSRILLSGETAAPVNVPLFLKRLSDGHSFRGQRFDEFRLEAQESGLLRFDIVGPDRERSG